MKHRHVVDPGRFETLHPDRSCDPALRGEESRLPGTHHPTSLRHRDRANGRLVKAGHGALGETNPKETFTRADPQLAGRSFREVPHVKRSEAGTDFGPGTLAVDEQASEVEAGHEVGSPRGQGGGDASRQGQGDVDPIEAIG